ncbi:MAG: FAD-dependent monooxygenase [Gammaproteobacteria bacterium]
MNPDYDVIIAGGGMTGASLACALGGRQIKVALLEANTPQTAACGYDDRGIALSLSSMHIYDSLGLWSQLGEHVTPIERIHVSEKGRFPKVRFSAARQGLAALGYVVIARQLGNVLLQTIERLDNIEFITPARSTGVVRNADHVAVSFDQAGSEKTITGKLLVVADGADSHTGKLLGITTQITDYAERAFVTHVMPEKPHLNTAYERFTPQGSVALLPSTAGRCVAIYVAAEETAAVLEQLSPPALLEKIQQRLGKRLGVLQRPGKVKSYPLACMTADCQVQERVVLLGNAAHTVHPNAAQGFNLCLRDTAALAALISAQSASASDPGDVQALQQYYQTRRADQRKVMAFTRGLHSLFYTRNPLKQFARHSIMFAIDAVPMLKHCVIRQASGLAD